jgi:hypothetical protein
MDEKSRDLIYGRLPGLLDLFVDIDREMYDFLSQRCLNMLIIGMNTYTHDGKGVLIAIHYKAESADQGVNSAEKTFRIMSGFLDLGYEIARLEGVPSTGFEEAVEEVSARLGCYDYCEEALKDLRKGAGKES